MKTLLLFAVESAEAHFDEEMLSMLREEQERHRSLYRMDVVRVRIGEDDRFSAGDLEWNMRTNGAGDPVDPDAFDKCALQLTTELFSRMQGACECCEIALIGSGDGRTELAALQLGQKLTGLFLKLTAINTHLMLLQDQKALQNEQTARLMQAIRHYSSLQPAYYSSLNLLAWEIDRQKDTRRAVVALLKTIIMQNGHALGVAGALRTDRWIETAAVTRLMPPVKQIRHKVFRYLADDFEKSVLQPALEPAGQMDVRTNDLQDCVSEIVKTLQELEQRSGLPSLEELYMMMPVREPSITLTAKDDLSSAQAWDRIYEIYGDHGRELYGRMYPEMDSLVAEYDSQQSAITVLLLNKALEIGKKRSGCGFEMLPDIIDNIKRQVLDRLERIQPPLSEPQKYVLAITPGRKKCVSSARTRHILLNTVYDAAQRQFGSKRADLRAKMFRTAADVAKVYLSDCILELKTQFDQMCAIRDSSLPSQEYFSYRLDEAYDGWCRQRLTDKVGLQALYECFSEDVCRMPYREAAEILCDRLEQLIDERTRVATDMIKVHINSFFSELKYRAGLLAAIDGREDDLDSKLLAHLQDQLAAPPLMRMVSIEPKLMPVSRMFIIHRSASADTFAGLIEQNHDGTGILNDPYEDGVQMIVKYAGNALDELWVYRNNLPEGMEG